MLRPSLLFVTLLLGSCAERDIPRPADDSIDVAIVTVIAEEYRAVLAHLDLAASTAAASSATNEFAWTHATLARPNRPPLNIVVALAGEAGTTSGALAVMRTAQRWQPDTLLLVGIAGGVPGKIDRGDVLVSEAIWGYEYGSVDNAFRSRLDWLYRPDQQLLLAAQQVTDGWQNQIGAEAPIEGVRPTVTRGVTASGNKVIENLGSAFFDEVTARYSQFDSVEMEGAGALAAAELLRERAYAPRVLMLRGISDIPIDPALLGDKREREQWKRYAADSVAAFTAAFLREALPESRGETRYETDVLLLSFSPTAFNATAAKLSDTNGDQTHRSGTIPSHQYPGAFRAVAALLDANASHDDILTVLERWRPRYVLVVDTALGIAPLDTGDIAVGRLIWPYQESIDGIDAQLSDAYRASRALINMTQSVPEQWRQGVSTKIKAGALATADNAPRPDDTALLNAIVAANPRTVALDQESTRVAVAIAGWQSSGNTIGLLSIQGIEQVMGSDTREQNAAAETAAALSIVLIQSHWPTAPLTR